MVKRLLLVWCLLIGVATPMAAQTLLPKPTTMVVDAVHALAPATVNELESTVRAYEAQSHREIAVVVTNIGSESIENYTTKLFASWGVGKAKSDNGVMLLWAPDARKVRIEVGYGLEGTLPDGRAGDIWRQKMLPLFRANRFDEGMRAGVQGIIAELQREPQTPAEAADVVVPPSNGFITGLKIVVCIGVLLLVILVVYARLWASDEDEWDDAYAPITPTNPSARVEPVSYASTYERTSRRDDDYRPSSRSYDNDSSSSSFDFGGGSSGGGGATGSY